MLLAADQTLMFLYPDAQNLQGTRLIAQALYGILPVHLVFSRVPTESNKGMEKVKQQWEILKAEDVGLGRSANGSGEYQVIPYFTDIALADKYPVEEALPHYAGIADLIEHTSIERLPV